MNLTPSTFWQSATMAVILLSFLMALAGNENALRLWIDGWSGMAVLLGGGVGMKMTAQSMERIAEKKYGKRPTGLPDGEA